MSLVGNGRTAKFLTGVFALTFTLSMTVQPLVLGAVASNVKVDPAIAITNINGTGSPFSFTCPANPLVNPVTLSGNGSGEAPPGDASQYHVQLDWGDGSPVESGLGTFTPNSGHVQFTFTFSAGPHTYATDGSKVITAKLYHQNANGNDNTIDATYSVTVCIQVTPVTYTLNYVAGLNGSVTGNLSQTVNSGANGTAVDAVADLGYHFVNWSDSSTADPRTDTNVTANHTYTANFAQDVVVPGNHTITASAGTGGIIAATGAVSVVDGANQGFTITPDTGYHVADVLVDGSSVGPVTTYNFTGVTADHTISANFAINQYTLTYNSDSNGSITGTALQTVNYGDNGTIVTAVANSGYHFVNWTEDSSTTNPRIENNVVANQTYSAVFAADPQVTQYTLDVTISSGEGDGEGVVTDDLSQINCDSTFVATEENPTNDCSGTYNAGTNVTLTAAAHTGSTFEGSWTSGPCTGSNNPVCVVTVGSSQTVNAHFSLNPVTPPATPTPNPCPNGCGGGGGGGSYYYPTPTPTPAPSATPTPSVAPEVLGATTLPATSTTSASSMAFSFFISMIATGAMMMMIGFGLVPKKLRNYLK